MKFKLKNSIEHFSRLFSVQLYTVVHNVKQAYEVQESGETQDFMDDIEYLLDSLRDDQPSSIRTLR